MSDELVGTYWKLTAPGLGSWRLVFLEGGRLAYTDPAVILDWDPAFWVEHPWRANGRWRRSGGRLFVDFEGGVIEYEGFLGSDGMEGVWRLREDVRSTEGVWQLREHARSTARCRQWTAERRAHFDDDDELFAGRTTVDVPLVWHDWLDGKPAPPPVRLTRWLVEAGQVVELGAGVAELDTPQRKLMLRAPAAGTIVELCLGAPVVLANGNHILILQRPIERVDHLADVDAHYQT